MKNAERLLNMTFTHDMVGLDVDALRHLLGGRVLAQRWIHQVHDISHGSFECCDKNLAALGSEFAMGLGVRTVFMRSMSCSVL